MSKKEKEITTNAELIAEQLSSILSNNNERYIDYNMVYQYVRSVVDEKSIEDVCRQTINILEDKYGTLFDVDKNINV